MAASTSLVDLEKVLEVVEEVNGQVNEYKENTQQARDIHNKLLTMPWGQVNRDNLTTRLDSLHNQNKKIAKNVRDLIKKGEALKVEQESVKEEKLRSASVWLQNAMMEYNNEQIQYSNKSKENLVKAILITGTELTSDQIRHKIDSGHFSNDIFTESIIQDTAEASRQLEEVHLRHNEMLNLEESLRELSELMEEVKMLVSGQQKQVNHIECNIEEAGANVTSAVSFLNRAAKFKEKARGKKTLIMGAISSLAIILVIIIVAASRPNSSSTSVSKNTTIIVVNPNSSPIPPTEEPDDNEGVISLCTQDWPLPCHPDCPAAGTATALCMCGEETCKPKETCSKGICK